MTAKRTISGLTPGLWAFRVRAKDNSGRIGEWSPVFQYTVVGDIVPPPVPSKPVVEAVIGGAFVKWVETSYQQPSDFNRVDVYVSTGGAYTKTSSIASINAGITYTAPDGVSGPFTFKFAGVDRSGNVSDLSEASDPVTPLSFGIDTEPPLPPSSLTVTAFSDPSDKSGATGYVDVTWGGSSSSDLYGYYIRYGRSATVWDEYLFMEKGQTTKRIYNLRSGQTYYFQVNATDGSNPSAYIPAIPVTATIPGDTTAPVSPTGLTAVAGFNNIVAYWNRNSEGDVDLGRGQYEFQISAASSFATILQSRVISGTVATFTGLTTDTTYYIRVRAIDSSGNIGSWSSIVSATPGKVNAETSISAGTIVGNLVAANTIVGDKLVSNTIDADRLKTNTGIVGKLYVGDETGTNKITIDGTAGIPAVYYGTGTYNNSNTPFYFDALGKFSLKDQLFWDGSSLTIKGSINVTQASTFTGNVTLNNGGDIILNGGAIRATSGLNKVELGAAGIVGYNNGTVQAAIYANTGQLYAIGGTIGGWNIAPGSLTTTNSAGQTVGLYSTGQLYMGPNFSVGANGSVTINGTINVTGGNAATTTDLAGKVSSGDVKNHLGGTNVTTISGGIINTGTINLNNVYVNSGTGANSIRLDSTGLKIYDNNGTATVSLNSNGSASFTGTVAGSTITGGTINITGQTFSSATNDGEGASGSDTGLSNSFTSEYVRNGITNLGINGISLISANTAGVISSWYPYYDGTVDLGIKASATGTYSAYRWRNARLTGDLYIGGDGSTNSVGTSAGPIIRLFNTGRIYANTLGVNSGTAIVQDSSGYLRVSSSSRRYKENIQPITGTYLNAIKLLQPVTFNYKEEFSGLEENPITSGLIAEDVAEIEELSTVVNFNNEGNPESISYDRLAVFLAVAIKELSDKVDTLSNRLDELQA